MKKFFYLGLFLMAVSACSTADEPVVPSSMKISNTLDEAITIEVRITPRDMQSCEYDTRKKEYIECEDIVEVYQDPQEFVIAPGDSIEQSLDLKVYDTLHISEVGAISFHSEEFLGDSQSSLPIEIDADIVLDESININKLEGKLTYESGLALNFTNGEFEQSEEYCLEQIEKFPGSEFPSCNHLGLG